MTSARSEEQMTERGKITTSVKGVDNGARSEQQMTEQEKITPSVQGVDEQCKEQGADDGARKNDNDQCARDGRLVQGARSR